MVNLLRQSSGSKRQMIVALGFACVALAVVATADYLTPYEVNLEAFYLLIILLVSWYCGLPWGLLFATLCMIAEIEVDRLIGTPYSAPVYSHIANANIFFAYLLTALLASGFRTLYLREQSLVRVDFLTGAANYKAFYERVSMEMARQRRHNQPFAVAYIDCDYFKVINDNLGHSEGDRVLQVIAGTMQSNIRETDLVARLGGDEFALVFSHMGEFGALQAIKKVRTEVDAAMDKNGWPTTLSIGVGIFISAPENVDRILSFCDKVMYKAKTAGKNKVLHRVYDPDEPDTIPPAQLAAK